MWVTLFWALVVFLILRFVWRFVSRMWAPRQPIEHVDEGDILADLDGFDSGDEADIFAGLPRRPILNSGAVALEEPDEGVDDENFLDAGGQSRQKRINPDDQSAFGTASSG